MASNIKICLNKNEIGMIRTKSILLNKQDVLIEQDRIRLRWCTKNLKIIEHAYVIIRYLRVVIEKEGKPHICAVSI